MTEYSINHLLVLNSLVSKEVEDDWSFECDRTGLYMILPDAENDTQDHRWTEDWQTADVSGSRPSEKGVVRVHCKYL